MLFFIDQKRFLHNKPLKVERCRDNQENIDPGIDDKKDPKIGPDLSYKGILS
jgi:hypothetical protein